MCVLTRTQYDQNFIYAECQMKREEHQIFLGLQDITCNYAYPDRNEQQHLVRHGLKCLLCMQTWTTANIKEKVIAGSKQVLRILNKLVNKPLFFVYSQYTFHLITSRIRGKYILIDLHGSCLSYMNSSYCLTFQLQNLPPISIITTANVLCV